MKKCIIVAIVDKNNALGHKGKLLGQFPKDLQRFRKITLGGAVIMGAKTFRSLPNGPLDGRTNIVLSKSISEDEAHDCIIARNMFDILQILRTLPKDQPVFVIGGGEIYRQFLSHNLVDQIILTKINHAFPEADTFFPICNYKKWRLCSKEYFCDNGFELITYRCIKRQLPCDDIL